MTISPPKGADRPASPSAYGTPRPERLAEPTWWPPALAFGAALTAWGLITAALLLGVGMIVIAVAISGWIGDICHEHDEH